MAKMGRPQIEIDRKQFENLCGLWCSLTDIAGWFECSEDTIERWCKRTYEMTFAEAYKRYSAKGNVSLRRKQFNLADKSATMAIFLGKQYLGQRDYEEVNVANLDKAKEILEGVESVID